MAISQVKMPLRSARLENRTKIMSNFAIIRIEKRKDVERNLEIHFTRHRHPDNADPSRKHLNRNLIDLNGKSIHDAAMARLNEAGIKLRKGQNIAIEIVLTGSTAAMLAMSEDTLESWINDNMDFVDRHWGKENIISAVLHRDETAPHLHIIVVPIVSGKSHRTKRAHEADAGNQHKRYHKDATRLRLSVVEEMESEKLDYYWDIYAAEVGAKYGLQRGVRAKKGSKVSHTDSTEYNRALERENRRIQTENAELSRRNSKLQKEADELENRIDSENKILEIRAEEAQLPKPDFLGRYKEEDVRQYLQDAAGSQIVTRRSAVYSGDRIDRLESENAYLREQLAKGEEILKDPAKLRSKANTIEFKHKVSASLKTRYGKEGSLRIIGKVKGTDATVLTCTVGSLRHIVVARPDGEAFLYSYAPKLGVVGMDKVANLAVHREQSSPNRVINVSVAQVVRMAQILTPDTSQVKGSSWSGKVPLTGDQLEELYQIGRTGALSFSFEDHSLEDHLV